MTYNNSEFQQQQQPQQPVAPAVPKADVDEATMFQAFVLHFLTIIFPLVIVFSPRQRGNRYLRFYAFQYLFLFVATLIVEIAAAIIFYGMGGILMIVTESLVLYVVFMVFGSIVTIVWCILVLIWTIVSALKAYNGVIYKMPIVGNIAIKKAFLNQ